MRDSNSQRSPHPVLRRLRHDEVREGVKGQRRIREDDYRPTQSRRISQRGEREEPDDVPREEPCRMSDQQRRKNVCQFAGQAAQTAQPRPSPQAEADEERREEATVERINLVWVSSLARPPADFMNRADQQMMK